MKISTIQQHFGKYGSFTKEEYRNYFDVYKTNEDVLELEQWHYLHEKESLKISYIIDEKLNIKIESLFAKNYKHKPEVTLENEKFIETVKRIHETLSFLDKELNKILLEEE